MILQQDKPLLLVDTADARVAEFSLPPCRCLVVQGVGAFDFICCADAAVTD